MTHYNKIKQNEVICPICNNKSKPYKKINDAEYACKKCYGLHFQPQRLCSICDKISIVKKL
jgi:RNA polymerase subunit RPABC4/transcription elongation factor Spt4